jgi:hypothetical protein
MSFANFILPLHASRTTKSARGDFIADSKTLINARAFPAVTSWPELYKFLRTRNACPETIDEARKLWRAYQKSTTPETVQ